MSWNYRVVKYVDSGITLYGITEVYYNKEEKVEAWVDPLNIRPLNAWESKEELFATYTMIREAFLKPILNLETKQDES